MITITINTDNAAFNGNPNEIKRVLAIVAEVIDVDHNAHFISVRLFDSNGNTVGKVVISDE